MKLLTLDDMVTPKILTSLYILTSLIAFAVLIFSLANGRTTGAILMAFALVFNRVVFECIIVAFKNNEYLKSSSESLHQIARLLADTAVENKIKTAQNTAPDADFNVNNKDTAADKNQPVNSQDKQ